MPIEVKEYKKLTDDILNQVLLMEKLIFEKPLSNEKIKSELSVKNDVLILMAYDDKKPVGYKIGFRRTGRVFYSWIGGVIPESRRNGVAERLMAIQHKYAKDNGYQVVSTHSNNSFKPMIILNLKSGFDIKGTFQSTGDDYVTIVMEKDLT